ncbi:MAG: flagellar basal body rod C-terminal domain-containing protein [Bryobacteraceae bacterium]|jgi:flagellar hook protein FlgE
MIGLIQPLNGLLHSAAQFNQAASNITRATLPTSSGQDTVELSTAAVSMAQAKNSFEANNKVFKTVDEMDKTLINAVG